jgi:hypothetical protein
LGSVKVNVKVCVSALPAPGLTEVGMRVAAVDVVNDQMDDAPVPPEFMATIFQ